MAHPITRKEAYLAYLGGDTSVELPVPLTREEIFLYYACINGGSGGGGLPSGGSPNQVLVTDSDGNAHWEDKPFYTDGGMVEVLPECQGELLGEGFSIPNSAEITAGENYIVNWNGVEYHATTVDLPLVLEGVPTLLNEGADLDAGENAVFVIQLFPELVEDEGMTFGGYAIAMDGSTSLTLSVYQGGETVHKMDNKFLDLDWFPAFKEVPRASVQIAEGSSSVITNDLNESMVRLEQILVVLWDDVRYETAVFAYSNGTFMAGDISSLDSSYPNTGEPFVITFAEDKAEVNSLLDKNAHTCVISTRDGNKIPDDFLHGSMNGPYLLVAKTNQYNSYMTSDFAEQDDGTYQYTASVPGALADYALVQAFPFKTTRKEFFARNFRAVDWADGTVTIACDRLPSGTNTPGMCFCFYEEATV